ncbi:energy-coupling factor transporter ATP-binding protein EcfA [Spirochaetia bacterium]|nr:energy-coupling factor transporter ATP-binding protein EcfA [Spirochaetia bacterium]
MPLVRSVQMTYEYEPAGDGGRAAPVRQTARPALDEINLDIEKGSFVVIVGQNGSGKSTFAKHINGILTPTGGSILVYDRDTAVAGNIFEIRKKVGMVFQNPDNQIIGSIVEEDVAFGPENLGIAPEEIRLRVAESLAQVRMSEYRRSSPNRLSGGQKQRVSIAGILAMKSDCIVLDEPTAMLDPQGRQEVLALLKKLNREEGITVILITHHMEEAIQADRVIVIGEGQVVLDGRPRDIFAQADILKGLALDLPPVTELAHELRRDGLEVESGILSIDELAEALCQLG